VWYFSVQSTNPQGLEIKTEISGFKVQGQCDAYRLGTADMFEELGTKVTISKCIERRDA
jgi:hypothetical protein